VSEAARHRPVLTRRESEIVRLVADGLSDKEIAASLHLSRNTVRTHLRRLFHKYALHSRAEAVAVLLEVLERDLPITQR
jgi:DNA-binding CsgD family transcriptional regulator